MDASMHIMFDSSMDRRSLHYETQERSLRVPSPPKVWIPPPEVTSTGLPDLGFVANSADRHVDSSFDNTDFLQEVTYETVLQRDVGRDWRYEERRQAQEILPFLYLGPDAAARDRKWLSETGITMCMAVRNTHTARANFLNPKAPRDLGISIANVDVMGNSQLISEFPKAIGQINQHLNAKYYEQKRDNSAQPSLPPGKVLVFCETGNERSAAVVAAYAMAMYSLDITRAIQLVQSSRFCVALDYQVAHLLRSYQAILEARRDVHRYRSATPAETPSTGTSGTMKFETLSLQPRKRGLDETRDEDDVDMEDFMDAQMDAERFANRQPQAPFADAAYETI